MTIRSVVLAILGVIGLGHSVSAASVLPPEVTPPSEMPQTIEPTKIITQGLQYLMYAIGVISVVMIIIGGIRYATSGGSADKVKSAKNTILYACVGLAVALLALAIVTFVQSTVTGMK